MSGSAFESAWASLKSDDPDRIEKILPLVVPLALAGYGAYQGVKNVRENQITDPLLGIKVAEGGDSFGSNAAEFASGAAQGIGAGAALRMGGRAAAKIGGRKAAQIAAERAAAREAAEASTRAALAREQADAVQAAVMRQGISKPATMAAMDDDIVAAAARSPYVNSQARAAGREAYQPGAFREGSYRGLERAGSAFDQSARRMIGVPLATGALGTLGIAGLSGASRMGLFGGSPSELSGESASFGSMGSQPQSFGAGSAMGAGAGNLANVQGNATADRVIFDPLLAQGNQALTGFEGQQEFGGFGVRTGEDMYIGDRLMKSVVEDMHRKALLKKEGLCKGGCGQTIKMCGCEKTVKAECPKCGKNCSCDQKNKADKKPAHGMVIVIGSKAGPGPMTEGKRDKLDSEKGSDKDD
jgi:hypothetical protein